MIIRSWLEEIEVKEKKKKRIGDEISLKNTIGIVDQKKKLFCKFVRSWRIIGVDCWCFGRDILLSVFLCIFWESFPFQEMHFTGKGTGLNEVLCNFYLSRTGTFFALYWKTCMFVSMFFFRCYRFYRKKFPFEIEEKKISLRWVDLSKRKKNELN